VVTVTNVGRVGIFKQKDRFILEYFRTWNIVTVRSVVIDETDVVVIEAKNESKSIVIISKHR
jgi:hypothetical protein